MTFGALLIAAAGGLFVFNTLTENKAGESADEVLSEFEEVIGNSEKATVENDEKGEKTISLDGEKYIGIISIPSIGVELPVQSEYSLEKMKNAPCRYRGTLLDGDIIICAHNYRRHFGNLHHTSIGDKVYFTDAAGLTYTYEIVFAQRIDSYGIEEMTADGDWDMTLFTCTYSGRQRYTLRLKRVLEFVSD